MLNSFDKEPATSRPPESFFFVQGWHLPVDEPHPGELDPVTPRKQRVARIKARRWLIFLFAAIVLVLAALYRIPLEAAFVAMATFAAGAALIPRSGLQSRSRAAGQSHSKAAGPLEAATILIGGLPDPAVILSKDGTVLSFNGKAQELFPGLKSGAHLSSATRNPLILDAIAERSMNAPSQTVIFNERVPVERYMAATISWLGAQECETPCILLFIRDLTEQRRLDQLRSDFIANASHEIKTPLASLLGFIDTLQGAARHDEAARDRFLAIMAKQGARMARLIDNLMSLSRVEMRAHLKPRDEVLIERLVEQACEALEPMAAERDIKVTVTSGIEGAIVLGDWDELMQVFINLLHNAIKYGRPGGAVHVSMQRKQTETKSLAEISIQDDGPGIPAQHLPRLTERFYRVQTPDALEKGGTGLGLAIVKHVVNRHRGELRIASQEGAGSTFIVVLDELAPVRCALPAPAVDT